jgi:2',3'-cyclic-nucleotide 2'-phosphodiesterase (5'-nucleotidase family)
MGSGSGTDIVEDALIARVLGVLRYDALNAGVSELLAGPSALAELKDGSPPLVSANGALADAGAPRDLVKPYVVKDVKGLRVALVGVTVGGPAANGTLESVNPPADALRAILSEVRSKSDVVVVLADVDVSSVRILAEEGLGLDVLLGTRSQANREPTLIGKTLVANAGGLGGFVNRVTIVFGSDGSISTFSGEQVQLDDSVADDLVIAKIRDEY